MIRFLRAGVDVNCAREFTVLQAVAGGGYEQIVYLLLKASADGNYITKFFDELPLGRARKGRHWRLWTGY